METYKPFRIRQVGDLMFQNARLLEDLVKTMATRHSNLGLKVVEFRLGTALTQ